MRLRHNAKFFGTTLFHLKTAKSCNVIIENATDCRYEKKLSSSEDLAIFVSMHEEVECHFP